MTPPTYATPPPIPTGGPSATLLARTQRWIEDNQKILILGAAVAVVSGAGYLLYNRPTSRGSTPGSGGSESGAGGVGSKKKNKGKKGKKSGSSGLKEGFLRGEGDDGPLLEEITPPPPANKNVEEKGKGAEVEKPSVPDHLEGE